MNDYLYEDNRDNVFYKAHNYDVPLTSVHTMLTESMYLSPLDLQTLWSTEPAFGVFR